MNKRLIALLTAGAAVLSFGMVNAQDAAVTPEPGKSVNMILLPKFLGIAVFDQAHQGAEEAAAELQNPGKLEFLGPTQDNSAAGQVEIVTTASTRKDVGAIMISNNAGDQLAPALAAAKAAGQTVVTWDSPIPSGANEDLFVAQVDFAQTGGVMADMALDILGANGGKFAVLSASPDAANQNAWIKSLQDTLKDPKYAKLNLVDIVYGNDETNADDTFSSLAGDLSEGMITAMLTTELHPSPELLAFRDAYKKKFGVDATPFSAGAYDSIKMLAQVINEVKSTKPKDLQKGFNAVQDFKGMTGNIGFSKTSHITITAAQVTLVKHDAKSKSWVEVTD